MNWSKIESLCLENIEYIAVDLMPWGAWEHIWIAGANQIIFAGHLDW